MKNFIARLLLGAGAALVALTVAATTAPAASAYTLQSITPWMTNATPVAWSANPDRIFYNAVGSGGLWNGYSANPDGSDPTCVTCTVPSLGGT